jgi:catalase-peroxidase
MILFMSQLNAFLLLLLQHAQPTYSDGRGGAEGGCQRFEPELSWDDNTNLVHAHKLLGPIKHKHGLGLSWGDLIVLAGTVAIEDMGGPILGFSAGRIDHVDNSQTIGLGPSDEQERFQHVEVNGKAPAPLGQNTMGLIYVNPEGPMGDPDPQGAADTIRDVFGRMGMDDRENVALIGGGHTFGKCHGAGPEGPGPKPSECPHNPYPGARGTGKGKDTITSGIEGPWTSNPTRWDNEYFTSLLNYEWEKYKGPGGAWQWRVKGGNGPTAPAPHKDAEPQDIMMLTTDVALVVDPEYRKYVEEFANDPDAYADAFAKVWYKLVNRDMGPHERCVGPWVPPPQPFQYPLPDASSANLADMKAVQKEVEKLVSMGDNEDHFIRLAQNAAGTFRHTDYSGGANGARIRFSPGKDWKINEGLDTTLQHLEPVKNKFGDGLSWADLIVLAGNVAAKSRGAPQDLPFCPGRTDASDGTGWEMLGDRGYDDHPKTVQDVVDRNDLRGLTDQEYVALAFVNYPSVEALQKMCESTKLEDEDIYTQALKYHPSYKNWVDYYVPLGDDTYQTDFGHAWTKLMNADRFEGPVRRVCTRPGAQHSAL